MQHAPHVAAGEVSLHDKPGPGPFAEAGSDTRQSDTERRHTHTGGSGVQHPLHPGSGTVLPQEQLLARIMELERSVRMVLMQRKSAYAASAQEARIAAAALSPRALGAPSPQAEPATASAATGTAVPFAPAVPPASSILAAPSAAAVVSAVTGTRNGHAHKHATAISSGTSNGKGQPRQRRSPSPGMVNEGSTQAPSRPDIKPSPPPLSSAAQQPLRAGGKVPLTREALLQAQAALESEAYHRHRPYSPPGRSPMHGSSVTPPASPFTALERQLQQELGQLEQSLHRVRTGGAHKAGGGP